MIYIKQILYELKTQKMVTWVSISGTSLAIFLVMAIFMGDRLKEIEMAPASLRSRIVIGQSVDFRYNDGGGSGSGMGIDPVLAKNIYGDLDGIERISFVELPWGHADLGVQNGLNVSAQTLGVDEEYWKIYDYKFLSGTPFTKEEIESGNKLAIINETTARAIFSETDVAGRQIDINNNPYLIKGVIEDVFPLLPDGTVSVFTNFNPEFDASNFGEGIFGKSNVRLLMKDGVDPDYIKQQVEKRYADANRLLEKSNQTLFYHKQPYTSAELAAGSFGSNRDPNLDSERKYRTLIYVILLLLPAINLSNMTRSRLLNRISEIGVRRAFGAKRKSIITQIFTENLLMTFIGGCIGLCLSLIFLAFLSGYFIVFNDPTTFDPIESANVGSKIWYVFDFSTFFIAFGACFILNVMSATFPAWKASAIEPAAAISKSR